MLDLRVSLLDLGLEVPLLGLVEVKGNPGTNRTVIQQQSESLGDNNLECYED
jgi:hypothetical protein